MKKSLRKVLALMASLAMAFSMAACGGGSSSGGGVEPAEVPAEPNAGVAGVVFSVPEGWTLTSANEGSGVTFDAGNGFSFGISALNEQDIEDMKEYDPDNAAESVEDYFEKQNGDDKSLKERGITRSKTEVCGTEAYEYLAESKKGLAGIGTNFLLDDVCYMVYLDSDNEYDEDGKLKDDAPAMGDELEAQYRGVLGSIKAGDGEALLMDNLTADSIGEITFAIPEGFKLSSLSEGYITMSKPGTDVELSINLTKEEDLQYYTDENGNVPESLEEEYKNDTQYNEDEDKATIAGFDGYMQVYPYEDDTYYDVSAIFLGKEGIYNIMMSTAAWDDDGEIKDDAESLSKEDIEAFKTFVSGLKAK